MFGNSPFGFSGSGGGGGGGTIGGGGTLNYLCKFTPDGTTIGNSQLFDNGTSVGIGTITPDASSILDLTSTSKGFLSPRMTTTERDAISAPVNGLFIYNTTTSFFNYWNGSSWTQIDTATGGDVSGSGTTNRAVMWTDGANSVIGNSTWYYSTNDYLPVTSGSNIGDATHRIGTIFMASVFDYANDLNWITSSSTKMTLTTGGSLGVGTTTPIGSIEIVGTASPQDFYVTRYSSDNQAGGIIGRKARGTSGSPTAVLSGDTLSLLGGRGYGATGFSATNKANVSILAAENWSDTAQGTYISFNTTTAGGTTRAEVATLNNSALTLSAIAINEVQASSIASASTTDIGAAKGNYVSITGTTTITALGTIQAGTRRVVTFTGALTLTYNAVSLILPTSANITTAAGDSAVFISLGSGNWKCVQYQRNDGTSLGYTFSTGLTNTSGTITSNISIGVTGGQTIIGGTGVTDKITYKGTNGNGTSTASAHSFVVGNNGATTALEILNSANVKITTGYVGIATDAVTNQPITSSFSLNGQLISRFINTNGSGAAISSIATQNNSAQSQSCNKLSSAYTTAGLLTASLNWYHGNVGNTLYSNSASSTAHIWSIGGTAVANEVMRIESTAFTLADAIDIVVGTTRGTKIGTSTKQKLSMWNATPIVQPTTGIAASTFVANTSGIANDTATFDGYTIGQVVKALRDIGALA